MGALIWKKATINGDRVYFVDVHETRLYVKERATLVEAWDGSIKVGNFPDVQSAKKACAERVGLVIAPEVEVAPKPPRPFVGRPNARKQQDPREVGPPRQMIYERGTGRKPPVRVEHEVKLHRHPIADLTQPPTSITEVAAMEKPTAATQSFPVGSPTCKCGARLDRRGICPALCEPLEQPQPPYRGPQVVGRTHLGRIARPVGAGWIG